MDRRDDADSTGTLATHAADGSPRGVASDVRAYRSILRHNDYAPRFSGKTRGVGSAALQAEHKALQPAPGCLDSFGVFTQNQGARHLSTRSPALPNVRRSVTSRPHTLHGVFAAPQLRPLLARTPQTQAFGLARFVGVAGLEPTISCSQSRRLTN